MLTGLTIHNYRSLHHVSLFALPQFCVFVGANAAGKSNLADAMDFLSCVFRRGLVEAVRSKGGYESICYRRMRRSKSGIEFEIHAVAEESAPSIPRGRGARAVEFIYRFAFKATTGAITTQHTVGIEELRFRGTSPDTGWVGLCRDGEHMTVADSSGLQALNKAMGEDMVGWLPDYAERVTVPADELFVPTRLSNVPVIWSLCWLLSRCRVYQISPDTAKQTGVPEGSPELGRHGENLPAAVEFLRRRQGDAYEELLSHLKHAVPSMRKLETDYVETKQLGLFFSEDGVGRRWLSHDVSDGTIRVVGMFVALLDRRSKIVVIEEPENSLHPWILRHFINACKAATGKQVFLTTHSLVALNESPLEAIFLVTRKAGSTAVEKCDEKHPEAKQVIAEQLMGPGELWDSGALDAVPEQLEMFQE